MKYKTNIHYVVSILCLSMGLLDRVEAKPMFSDQTGMDCSSCHLQQLPKLNKFGRKFVASGMTLSKQIIDNNSTKKGFFDDFLMHPSVLLKMKYENTDNMPTKSGHIKDDDKESGEWYLPKTATLFFAGKVSEHIGSMLRLSYREEDGNSISGKIIYSKEIEDGYIGASIYSFATFGPFSGIEPYNTGLYKPIRSFEIKQYVYATQICGVGTGAVTGLQLYYDKDTPFNDSDHIFLTFGLYAPDQDNRYMKLSDNLIPFGRVAYEYELGEFNLVFGAFAINGGSTTSSDNSLRVRRETYGVDFQLEGEIYDKSISVIATNIFKNKVTYTGIGANSTGDLESRDDEAFSIESEVMATDDLGLKIAYLQYNDLRDYDNRKYINTMDIDSAITLGVDYSFTLYMPMKLAVEHSWVEPHSDRIEHYRDFLVTLTMAF